MQDYCTMIGGCWWSRCPIRNQKSHKSVTMQNTALSNPLEILAQVDDIYVSWCHSFSKQRSHQIRRYVLEIILFWLNIIPSSLSSAIFWVFVYYQIRIIKLMFNELHRASSQLLHRGKETLPVHYSECHLHTWWFIF